jgi:hypothetical protein
LRKQGPGVGAQRDQTENERTYMPLFRFERYTDQDIDCFRHNYPQEQWKRIGPERWKMKTESEIVESCAIRQMEAELAEAHIYGSMENRIEFGKNGTYFLYGNFKQTVKEMQDAYDISGVAGGFDMIG